MPDLLIRNVPEHVVNALKTRAAQRHRSLQGELLAVLEAASGDPTGAAQSAAAVAERIRNALATRTETLGDSTELVREDRER